MLRKTTAAVVDEISILPTLISLSECDPVIMVVRIRLQRFGQKRLPFYRIVVADSRCPRDGKFIERVSWISLNCKIALLITSLSSLLLQVGTYNPIPTKENIKELTANSDRVHYWLSVGAQPSDRVAWLFGQIGLLPAAPVRNSTKHALPKELTKAK